MASLPTRARSRSRSTPEIRSSSGHGKVNAEHRADTAQRGQQQALPQITSAGERTSDTGLPAIAPHRGQAADQLLDGPGKSETRPRLQSRPSALQRQALHPPKKLRKPQPLHPRERYQLFYYIKCALEEKNAPELRKLVDAAAGYIEEFQQNDSEHLCSLLMVQSNPVIRCLVEAGVDMPALLAEQYPDEQSLSRSSKWWYPADMGIRDWIIHARLKKANTATLLNGFSGQNCSDFSKFYETYLLNQPEHVHLYYSLEDKKEFEPDPDEGLQVCFGDFYNKPPENIFDIGNSDLNSQVLRALFRIRVLALGVWDTGLAQVEKQFADTVMGSETQFKAYCARLLASLSDHKDEKIIRTDPKDFIVTYLPDLKVDDNYYEDSSDDGPMQREIDENSVDDGIIAELEDQNIEENLYEGFSEAGVKAMQHSFNMQFDALQELGLKGEQQLCAPYLESFQVLRDCLALAGASKTCDVAKLQQIVADHCGIPTPLDKLLASCAVEALELSGPEVFTLVFEAGTSLAEVVEQVHAARVEAMRPFFIDVLARRIKDHAIIETFNRITEHLPNACHESYTSFFYAHLSMLNDFLVQARVYQTVKELK